jgi:TetR/AcrR family fatty acid metabolism transcriptional regulator
MTSPLAKTKREKLEARETAIVQAAREAFLQLGVDGTTISEIAQRAGVSEGSLYLYFKNKQAILRAVVRDNWEDLTRGAVDAVGNIHGSFAQLEALAKFHLAALIDRWPLFELGLARHLASAEDEERNEINYKRNYVDSFDTAFKRGQDRGEIRPDIELWMARDLFYGTIEYSARSIMIDSRRQDLASVVEFIMHVFRTAGGLEQRPGVDGQAGNLKSLTRRLEAVLEDMNKLNQD